MVVLKRSLLDRENVLINVLNVLASVIFMCSHHVILLSKITLIYFTVLFPSKSYCTVACICSCYFAMGLHVTICSVLCWQTHIRRTALLVP